MCLPFSEKKFCVKMSMMSAQKTHISRTSPSWLVYLAIGMSKEMTLYLFGFDILLKIKMILNLGILK